jgi:hypothetical protein
VSHGGPEKIQVVLHIHLSRLSALNP